jgi:hypothetical protein
MAKATAGRRASSGDLPAAPVGGDAACMNQLAARTWRSRSVRRSGRDDRRSKKAIRAIVRYVVVVTTQRRSVIRLPVSGRTRPLSKRTARRYPLRPPRCEEGPLVRAAAPVRPLRPGAPYAAGSTFGQDSLSSGAKRAHVEREIGQAGLAARHGRTTLAEPEPSEMKATSGRPGRGGRAFECGPRTSGRTSSPPAGAIQISFTTLLGRRVPRLEDDVASRARSWRR